MAYRFCITIGRFTTKITHRDTYINTYTFKKKILYGQTNYSLTITFTEYEL